MGQVWRRKMHPNRVKVPMREGHDNGISPDKSFCEFERSRGAPDREL